MYIQRRRYNIFPRPRGFCSVRCVLTWDLADMWLVTTFQFVNGCLDSDEVLPIPLIFLLNNRPYQNSAQGKKRKRDKEEADTRKAVQTAMAGVIDDTKGLCSLSLQGKVSETEPEANEPRTLSTPLIPTCRRAVCQEVYGNQVQGGPPRSGVLQRRSGDNMYLGQRGSLLLASGPMYLQGSQTDNPFCASYPIGERCTDAAQGTQGGQREPKPPGSYQTERHGQGRPIRDGCVSATPHFPARPVAASKTGCLQRERRRTKRKRRQEQPVPTTEMHPQIQEIEIHRSASSHRLQQLLAGARTLCTTPVSQRDETRLEMGGPHAVKAVLRVTENIWEALLEWERGRPERRM